LLERWLAAGYLPHIDRIRRRGAYGRISGPGYYGAELAWTTFLTGSRPTSTGYWSPLKFDPRTYEIRDTGAFDFEDFPPFYALGDQYKIAVFDVPQAVIADDVRGLQVLAWGAHAPQTAPSSRPDELLEELIRRHGRHPAFDRDHASFWNPVAMARLERKLRKGIERRVAICLDLIERDRWDLFLTAFGEPHSAGHYLWHLSEESHPLHSLLGKRGTDPMLEILREIDRGIGRIVESMSDDATIVLFSPHGMESNMSDLPSMVFLPELLYRFSYPGRYGLSYSRTGVEPPPTVVRPKSLGWYREVWRSKYGGGTRWRLLRRLLPMRVGQVLERVAGDADGPAHPHEFGHLFYQPAIWYSRSWPAMRAFALLSFSDGCVRINLAGREAEGVVDPAEYDGLCEELTSHLRALTDARTGAPLVKDVIRTRESPLADDPSLPDPDLIVVWNAGPVDVVDSPAFGRIGPIPYGRTGSHVSRGFVLASGPGIQPASRFRDGALEDLAPTLLSLVGAPSTAHLAGTALEPLPG
jgi:predicted AlkP superfamily phosphohydrolase/phosphomutase